jgi:hypothetical protein
MGTEEIRGLPGLSVRPIISAKAFAAIKQSARTRLSVLGSATVVIQEPEVRTAWFAFWDCFLTNWPSFRLKSPSNRHQPQQNGLQQCLPPQQQSRFLLLRRPKTLVHTSPLNTSTPRTDQQEYE